MSIEAINEQLLRSVGVGVALFSTENLELQFSNDVFATWFSVTDSISLADLLPDLQLDVMIEEIAASATYTTEVKLRKKRRTLVIAQTFSQAEIGDQTIYILECQNISRIRELESMIDSYSKMVERNTREIQREKEQVEKLLLNVMPRSAYEEYKDFGVVTPQRYDNVAVLVLQFSNFSGQVDHLSPASLVSELNEIFTSFDRIGDQLRCERIRTSGNTYHCVAGMVDSNVNNMQVIGNAATRFIRYLQKRNQNSDHQWQCSIGIGTGACIGSVIGTHKYVFDIFGDAVRRAEQACATAGAMEIVVNSRAPSSNEYKELVFSPVTRLVDNRKQDLYTLTSSDS